jgi:hypothetical protein
MAISNERFKTLFLNWWKMYEKDMTLSDMEDLCKDIGMTRGEFIELVSRSGEFITKSGWTPPEPETNEKVNTETGEGIFWRAYIEEDEEEDEEISKPTDKSTPVPDYFRLIEMLDKVKAPYTNFKKERIIEIKEDYTAVDFCFDENFNLTEVAF